MPGLFDPLTLRSVTFRNRLFVSPMCQYAAAEDGRAVEWHLVHLGARALGGAGLVCVEATAVEPRGRISSHDLGLWSDDQVEPLQRIATFIRAQGAVPAIQLAHAGRKASTAEPWEGGRWVSTEGGGWLPVGPSALAFGSGSPEPQALTTGGIEEVVESFRGATRRALAAGFEVVEIHAAHGYLLHQFLSPLSNRRTDAYGGSFENRTRLAREVVQAVRAEWPERLPLFLRLSCTDWVEGGWDLAQTVRLASELKPLGVDLVDCSSGGIVPNASIPVGPGYQLPLARAVREGSGLPTIAVGMLDDPHRAEAAVREGDADAVMVARGFLNDPHLALHAARALGVDVAWPHRYERGRPAVR
jgi:2,4-dienoyl-CoA reductase-like NADH-dependent reductase (Old Yellow Enzyme family)